MAKTQRLIPTLHPRNMRTREGNHGAYRDIMKRVNKVAHLLAQKQYADRRDALVAACKEMLTIGKTRSDIDIYLADVGAGKNNV